MVQIPGRALHYVFKIGSRSKNSFFFREILGMKVLRHEEFKEGCEAQCNGPYDNRWSKTMVGYGPESSHFVIELTYNYGVQSYELGNDFGGITIHGHGILDRAKQHKYPIVDEALQKVLISPDGYKFYIVNKSLPDDKDPVTQVTLHVTKLAESRRYWHEVLAMKIVAEDDTSVTLSYGQNQASLRILEIEDPLNRAKAYGRFAFAVPAATQEVIDQVVRSVNSTILTPLIALDTPGKATVRVLILGDPDGHEICFVDEEGFSALAQIEEDSDAMLDRYIRKDPFEAQNSEK